ncbi:2Fe-2S iron-sulfur cluster-binding protein [Geomicrobium sp. JCM 19039]|uniref:2Fe-2S iron-sulfur cluster-binding protein n=1 Tax=Geomicrobium sp. JCM 19039 TaxID=1460636 RepID=UPI00045F31B8|nr:2Fe-2S iron-sulfur cluster-binding protein [Geomicrobium sp. JCM 19039]GAK14068.1 ferredoxin [Geomicrobium sp. JCM 19039]
MPQITVEGKGTFEVEEGKKLVLALEDNGIDILHRCGGNAKCTTCRCEVLAGDPGPIGEAEQEVRERRGIEENHIRLSCQIRVQSDLTVKPIRTASAEGLDAGPRPVD